ncbi:MAG TPA: molybdopterin-dependent oxidoreductase, partial [Gemmatimonadales bacterium]|nr:molybdopterin-dependent oxidoreductase [Gemmatimonadales bacterium]
MTLTHCPYCAFQCGMQLRVEGDVVTVQGDSEFPVNRGALCVKGWTAAETLAHPERLRTPLARGASGELATVSWDHALERIAAAFRETSARYGRDALGVFGGGSLTNEQAYLLGKFARVALGTRHVDYNGRFCMSSAAAAGNRAFGVDRGLPFPLEAIAPADAILLAGSNLAHTMPPIRRYLEAQGPNGGALIVVDPRRTATAELATVHLRLIPGTDAALANGLLHVVVRDGLVDGDFVRARTEGFERVKSVAATYWPERTERITGVPEAELVRAARVLGTAARPMVLTARGPEQH